MLALLLHPSFRKTAVAILDYNGAKHGAFSSNRNPLTRARIIQAAKFYSNKFELMNAAVDGAVDGGRQLHRDIVKWIISGPDGMGMMPFSASEDNVVEWWNVHSKETALLSKLAVFLLSAPVQSADCERLFKDYDFTHTKVRNRLKMQTVHNCTIIRHGIQMRRRKEKAAQLKRDGGLKVIKKPFKNRFVNPEQYPAAEDDGDEEDGAEHANDQPAAVTEDGLLEMTEDSLNLSLIHI